MPSRQRIRLGWRLRLATWRGLWDMRRGRLRSFRDVFGDDR